MESSPSSASTSGPDGDDADAYNLGATVLEADLDEGSLAREAGSDVSDDVTAILERRAALIKEIAPELTAPMADTIAIPSSETASAGSRPDMRERAMLEDGGERRRLSNGEEGLSSELEWTIVKMRQISFELRARAVVGLNLPTGGMIQRKQFERSTVCSLTGSFVDICANFLIDHLISATFSSLHLSAYCV